VSRCGTVAKGYDETFRTAFEFLASPCNLWKNGGFEDKRTVLKLTLNDPLVYDWNSGVRTAEFSLPFKLLGNESDREKLMAVGASLRTNSLGGALRIRVVSERTGAQIGFALLLAHAAALVPQPRPRGSGPLLVVPVNIAVRDAFS
jgi:hypothetical protein